MVASAFHGYITVKTSNLNNENKNFYISLQQTFWFEINVFWSWILECHCKRIEIVELSPEQTALEAVTRSSGG